MYRRGRSNPFVILLITTLAFSMLGEIPYLPGILLNIDLAKNSILDGFIIVRKFQRFVGIF